MTVHILGYEPDGEVVPQAIIWRPLRYCTLIVREGQDDLDSYEGASFIIGNEVQFDMRVYRGHIHREVTVTLYLPEELQDEQLVIETVTRIIQEMAIPVSAVAWRRGQSFQFGRLERSPDDRFREAEARLLVLKIAASQPDRSISLSKFREEIPRYFDLSSKDLSTSKSRPSEKLWHSIARNAMSSHYGGSKSIFTKGWAEKIAAGIKVTQEGLNYLSAIGFMDPASSDNDGAL